MRIEKFLLAVPMLLCASAAGATFHPPDGQSFAYVTTQTRSDGATVERFSARRTVVFHRAEQGWIAEVTLEKANADQFAPKGPGAMFEQAMQAFTGRTIRFHLDESGAILSVEGREALWTAFVDSIETIATRSGKPGAEADAKRLSAPLRGLPMLAQQSMLGSMLMPVLACKAAEEPIGESTVAVSARPPARDAGMLDGRRSVSIDADGAKRIALSAMGDIAVDTSTSHVTLERVRTIDQETGLLRESMETSVLALGKSPESKRLSIVTTVTLTPLVS